MYSTSSWSRQNILFHLSAQFGFIHLSIAVLTRFSTCFRRIGGMYITWWGAWSLTRGDISGPHNTVECELRSFSHRSRSPWMAYRNPIARSDLYRTMLQKKPRRDIDKCKSRHRPAQLESLWPSLDHRLCLDAVFHHWVKGHQGRPCCTSYCWINEVSFNLRITWMKPNVLTHHRDTGLICTSSPWAQYGSHIRAKRPLHQPIACREPR